MYYEIWVHCVMCEIGLLFCIREIVDDYDFL